MLDYDGFIIDLDGTIYRGDSMIHGADEVIKQLKKNGKKIVYLTNNSTKTTREYSKSLYKMGLSVHPKEILTSSMATSRYLQRLRMGGVYVIGEDSLKKEISNVGFKILNENDSLEAEYVICGLDRDFNYAKLAAACSAINNGALFIATNTDPLLPTESGLMPGAGAISSAIIAVTKRRPVVIGKPSKVIIEIALDMLKTAKEKTAIIGDSLDTDIQAGKNAGIFSILVLSGVTRASDPFISRKSPDLILSTIEDLMSLIV